MSRITREHLAVAVALEIPTALVITKTDAVSTKQLQLVLQQLQEVLAPVLATSSSNELSAALQPLDKAAAEPSAAAAASDSSTGAAYLGLPVVDSETQAAHLAGTLSDLHSCTAAGTAASFQQATYPVFLVSCVTGSGLSLLHSFLSRLQPISTLRRDAVGRPGHCGYDNHAGHGSDGSGVTPQQARQVARDRSPALHQHWQQVSKGPRSCQLWVPDVPAFSSYSGSGSSGSGEVSRTAVSLSSESSFTGMQNARLAVTDAGMNCYPAGHFQVVHTYDVQGVGWVVSGIAVAGEE